MPASSTRDGQLKIIDRAKDVGRLASGALFAPKYIENMLKFFPNIKEAVAFGDGRDFCAAFLNIDLQAVGNWAERNNIAYALLPGTRRPSRRSTRSSPAMSTRPTAGWPTSR